METIKKIVTCCGGCPLSWVDDTSTVCHHPNGVDIRFRGYAISKIVHPDCPLKNETVTIQLKEENEQ